MSYDMWVDMSVGRHTFMVLDKTDLLIVCQFFSRDTDGLFFNDQNYKSNAKIAEYWRLRLSVFFRENYLPC